MNTVGDVAGLVVRVGTRADVAALSHWHYAAGMPATIDRVLVASSDLMPGETAGVLCVSRAVLNATWREAAWPGVFGEGCTRTENAARVNEHVRCISRVIVDPRLRGVGIASALVRAYLREPLTTCTEAIAAAGGMCPFFRRAGMRAWTLGPTRRDRRLIAGLKAIGLRGRDLIVKPALSARRERLLIEALRAWARASRATSGRADGDLHELLALAVSAATSRRFVFTASGDVFSGIRA